MNMETLIEHAGRCTFADENLIEELEPETKKAVARWLKLQTANAYDDGFREGYDAGYDDAQEFWGQDEDS